MSDNRNQNAKRRQPGAIETTHYSTKRVRAEPGQHPQSGAHGMRIVYQDGYVSWCPTEVFQRDYQPLTAMSFGHALDALKRGEKVARAGWNGKGMWLSLSGPLNGREIAFENFWSSNNSEYARLNGGSANVLPCITMKTADGSILMGWLASQTDMLADDWMIVEG